MVVFARRLEEKNTYPFGRLERNGRGAGFYFTFPDNPSRKRAVILWGSTPFPHLRFD